MRSRCWLLCLILLTSIAVARAGERVHIIDTPNRGITPDAEVDQAGIIHLAYVLNEDVYYVKSPDDGKTFSEPLRVNSEPKSALAGMHRGPDLAVGKGGLVHVIWYNNGYQRKLPQDQWGVMYSHLNPEGTAFLPARNLNHKPSDNFSLAADSSGSVAVVWMAKGIYIHSSRDNGVTFSEPLRMELADPCECCGSRAYFDADGTLFCSYRDKANNWRDMYVAMLPKMARSFTREKLSLTPWQINGCPMSGNFLTGGKAGVTAAWETKGGVYFGRLDKGGHLRQPGEIRAGTGKYPVICSAPDGSTLVAWKQSSALAWRLFDADGKPQDEPQSVPSPNPHRPSGVVTKSGQFLLFN